MRPFAALLHTRLAWELTIPPGVRRVFAIGEGHRQPFPMLLRDALRAPALPSMLLGADQWRLDHSVPNGSDVMLDCEWIGQGGGPVYPPGPDRQRLLGLLAAAIVAACQPLTFGIGYQHGLSGGEIDAALAHPPMGLLDAIRATAEHCVWSAQCQVGYMGLGDPGPGSRNWWTSHSIARRVYGPALPLRGIQQVFRFGEQDPTPLAELADGQAFMEAVGGSAGVWAAPEFPDQLPAIQAALYFLASVAG